MCSSVFRHSTDILTPRDDIYEGGGEKIIARMGITTRELIFQPHLSLFPRRKRGGKADMRLRRRSTGRRRRRGRSRLARRALVRGRPRTNDLRVGADIPKISSDDKFPLSNASSSSLLTLLSPPSPPSFSLLSVSSHTVTEGRRCCQVCSTFTPRRKALLSSRLVRIVRSHPPARMDDGVMA